MNLKLNLTVPTNGQVNMMLITKEQYESLVQKITDLIDEKNLLSIKLYETEHTVWELLDKHENLHNFIIAEARVEAQKQKDKEYYTWCEKIAAKYEQLDYIEWCEEKDEYYRFWKTFCDKENLTFDEAKKYRIYYEHNRINLLGTTNEEAEGWSEDELYIRSSNYPAAFITAADTLDTITDLASQIGFWDEAKKYF